MKKIIIITSVMACVFANLSAQNRSVPVKTKSLLEANRNQSVMRTTAKSNTDLVEPEVKEIVAVAEEPKSVYEFSNESQFRAAYNQLLDEYLNEYTASNKKVVESNSTIYSAAALSIAKINSTNYSDCWSPTEVEFKKAQLRENIQRQVEELRSDTLNRIQAEYNGVIAKIDQRKTELDNVLASTEFILRDSEVCFSPYDNISKCWQCKIKSVNPEVKFESEWLHVKLDYESLEAQYENLAPKIAAGIHAETHYVVEILKYPEDPEELTSYNRIVTSIELFDNEGKRIAFFEGLNIPAGSWCWNSYRKQVFVDDTSVAVK